MSQHPVERAAYKICQLQEKKDNLLIKVSEVKHLIEAGCRPSTILGFIEANFPALPKYKPRA